MNKKIITGILIAVAVALAVYSFMVLPENVTVQVDFSGNPSNTFPKLLAVITPAAFSIGGAVGYVMGKESDKKALAVSLVGIAGSVLTLLFN